MRNIFTTILFFCFSVKAHTQSVSMTMLRLPDTGQNTSYTITFGEDADYSINTPFYFLNGNGTVSDTVTSLMWQKTDGGEMTIEDAEVYCNTLTLGGYTDWRLPNCHELFSIVNHDKLNPAIDTNYFTKTIAEYWWSSQRQANDSNKVWVTNAGGGIGNHPKTESLSAGGTKRFHVRAVRDVTSPTLLPNHFINNGNGTTTDLLTTLTWQQIPYFDSLTWEQALYHADTLTFSGYSDWRLPNIKELQSLTDESFINPSVNQAFFNGVNIDRYWSSSSLSNQITKAWYLDTQFGVITYQFKNSKLLALCVRGGNLATGMPENYFFQNDLLIYPNPSIRKVTIVNKSAIDNIQIKNSYGQIVFHSNPKSKSVEVEIYSVGIYFVTVTSNNVMSTEKIVITENR